MASLRHGAYAVGKGCYPRPAVASLDDFLFRNVLLLPAALMLKAGLLGAVRYERSRRQRSAETCCLARQAEDRVGHGGRDPAGERVLLARVVAAEQQLPAAGTRYLRLHAVPEGRAWPRHLVTALARVPARAPARQSRRGRPPPGGRRRPAGTRRRARARRCPAPPEGLVLRRRAAHGRGHAHADQPLAVPGRHARRPGGQAAPVQRREQESPLRSPVKIRPVRLPPCAAGASPSMRIAGSGTPAGHRAPPVRLVDEGLARTAATSSRQATRRGQARHTDCRAVSSGRVPALAASSRTSAASRAAGVDAVARSSGQLGMT